MKQARDNFQSPGNLDRTIEAETLRRWREGAVKDHGTLKLNEDSLQNEDWQPKFELNKQSTSEVALKGSNWNREIINNIKSALGPGTVIEGKFSFDSPVRIDGHLTGEVVSSSALVVGEQANITATIRVGSLIILGHVKGKVEAQELVEIKSCGHLEGNIKTKHIVIEEGGYFNGGCNINGL